MLCVCDLSHRDRFAFAAITSSAKDLKVLRRAGPAHRHWNYVVELKFYRAAAVPTTALIARPHELFNVVRDVATGRHRSWSVAHRDGLLSAVDPLVQPLLPSHQKRVNRLGVEVVVIPIEAVLELPVRPLIYSCYLYGESHLHLGRRSDVALVELAYPVRRAHADMKNDPSLA
jgi:hypothetical protein